jgi:hypothetical protein
MWSHYANEHKGICIEFSGSSILSSEKVLGLLHPVRYTKELLHFISCFKPDVDLEQVPSPSSPKINFDPLPILAACHKSEEWAYESEWRLVSLDPGSRKAPKFFLGSHGIKPSRIIVGARVDQANQEAIAELAQRISVPVANARLAKDRFEIEF